MGNERKIGIVMTGGGMRCVYAAGALHALATDLQFTKPHVILGASGSAGNAAYYAAGQFASLQHIWLDLLPNSPFISFRRKQIMDVDYLIDDIFKKQDPLNVAALTKSDTQCLFPATNFQTGIPHYFTNHDGNDPFELLRASKAIPLIFNETVRLGTETYLDGEIGTTRMDYIQEVVQRGCNTVVLIDSMSTKTLLSDQIVMFYAKLRLPQLQNAFQRDVQEVYKGCTAPADVDIVCIRAPKDLPAKLATRDQKKLTAAFTQGREDVLASRKLRAFISAQTQE